MEKYYLHEDRFFSADTTIRKYAREIYSTIKDMPIISPHGHVDISMFAENRPFPNPTKLFLTPDHYVYRMLYSQGITMEELGIPAIDGIDVEQDPKKIWQLFAENYHLFNGTPSGNWLAHEFNVVFGIEEKPCRENAQIIYDYLQEKIDSPEYLPRALFEKFNIEVLTSTDAASDLLENHKKIKESGWNKKIIPCFRPDGVTDLSNKRWRENLKALENSVCYEITNYHMFIKALEERRAFFKLMGATSTDHGVTYAYTHQLSDNEAEKIFSKALKENITEDEASQFTAHMLMEMARMSCEDGLTMQIHV
nr:glucuronate isomerase [Melioribacteraceae bacterium]